MCVVQHIFHTVEIYLEILLVCVCVMDKILEKKRQSASKCKNYEQCTSKLLLMSSKTTRKVHPALWGSNTEFKMKKIRGLFGSFVPNLSSHKL